MNDFEINQFNGLVTSIADTKTLKPGTAVSGTKNFLTSPFKDSIELRLGSALLGSTDRGVGKVTGLKVGLRPDGVQVPFFSYDRKLLYYDTVTADTAEAGTNVLPLLANAEDIAIETYSGLAGAFFYVSSPNSSVYKIPVANPGSVVDQLQTTYRGLIRIKTAKMFLWARKSLNGFKDFTGIYIRPDSKALYSDFTAVSNENVGTGNGATLTFTGTLAGRTGVRTVFNILIASPISTTVVTAITKATSAQVTSTAHGLALGDYVIISSVVGMTEINNKIGVVNAVVDANTFTVDINSTGFTTYTSGGTAGKCEYFTDNKAGVLVSNLGGTGTINYATGAVSVTFFTAPIVAPVLCAYLWEDATSGGILNDTVTSFRQDDAGSFMNIFSIGADEYCLHNLKTYILTVSSTIGNSTNLIYRNQVGIPYWRAAIENGDGIPYLDFTNANDPKVRILKPSQFSATVIPDDLSDNLNLTPYGFDYPVMFDWGNYLILACQGKTNSVNNTYNGVAFLYNKIGKFWDRCDFYISCLDQYNGGLLAGESISNNLTKLFSGYDEQGDIIDNAWISSEMDLGFSGVKKVNPFTIEGFIAADQVLDVYIAYDSGAFGLVKATGEDHSILGTGSYVDFSQGITIGSTTVGENTVGSGGTPNAYFYRRTFNISSDKFEYCKIKLQAVAIGAVQINKFKFSDIRAKGRKSLPVYQAQGI